MIATAISDNGQDQNYQPSAAERLSPPSISRVSHSQPSNISNASENRANANTESDLEMVFIEKYYT